MRIRAIILCYFNLTYIKNTPNFKKNAYSVKWRRFTEASCLRHYVYMEKNEMVVLIILFIFINRFVLQWRLNGSIN